MVRAWVNHYGAMYAALKALHDLARSYAGDWVTRSIRRRGEPAL